MLEGGIQKGKVEMTIQQQLESALLEVIQVTPKPDNDKGGRDWWVGLSVDDFGFWDTSCTSKEIANKTRIDCCRELAKYLAENLK